MADNLTQTIEHRSDAAQDWSAGAAYIDGAVMPLREARIPVTDWGYRRSDVTYDVVSVYFGAFFRLGDHLRRFRGSMEKLRLKPRESDEEIAAILTDLVRRTGLREAYVAMDCLRGRPPAGAPYHPAYSCNYLICFAIPWVWVFTPEQQERGIHAVIADTPRIPLEFGRSDGQEFSLGRFDARQLRGARSGRGNRDPARLRRERHRRSRVQRLCCG